MLAEITTELIESVFANRAAQVRRLDTLTVANDAMCECGHPAYWHAVDGGADLPGRGYKPGEVPTQLHRVYCIKRPDDVCPYTGPLCSCRQFRPADPEGGEGNG